MKLYEIPRNSKIRLEIIKPDDMKLRWNMCTFGHIDGAYSYITTEDGNIVHLSAGAEVRRIGNPNGDYYELATQPQKDKADE